MDECNVTAGCHVIIGYSDFIAGLWMQLKIQIDETENARCKNARRNP
jgi:hypothetical protein